MIERGYRVVGIQSFAQWPRRPDDPYFHEKWDIYKKERQEFTFESIEAWLYHVKDPERYLKELDFYVPRMFFAEADLQFRPTMAMFDWENRHTLEKKQYDLIYVI